MELFQIHCCVQSDEKRTLQIVSKKGHSCMIVNCDYPVQEASEYKRRIYQQGTRSLTGFYLRTSY